MGLGELILGGLLLKALSGSSSSNPPDPPAQPDAGGDGGKDKTAEDIAGVAGGAAGSILSAVLGAAGGGSTPTAVGTSAITGGVTGGVTGGGSTGSAVSAGVGGAFATSITAGGVFAMAWAAIFILQFVVINLVNNARTQWLRFRDAIFEFNRPLLHLQRFELMLVQATLKQLGIRDPGTQPIGERMDGSTKQEFNGAWNDPRLTITKRGTDGFTADRLIVPHWRQLMPNPFPVQSGKLLGLHNVQWHFLQMAARLVAARYCFELGVFSRGMLRSFPGLGGVSTPAPGNAAVEIWDYPLLGGGKTDVTYHDFAEALRKVQVQAGGYTIDDILNAARLAAMIQVASTVSMDPGINVPWDPARYSRELYVSFGLTPDKDGVVLDGQRWLVDPVKYRLPCSRAWLDIDELKRGLSVQPFLPGTNVPSPHAVTAFRVVL